MTGTVRPPLSPSQEDYLEAVLDLERTGRDGARGAVPGRVGTGRFGIRFEIGFA